MGVDAAQCSGRAQLSKQYLTIVVYSRLVDEVPAARYYHRFQNFRVSRVHKDQEMGAWTSQVNALRYATGRPRRLIVLKHDVLRVGFAISVSRRAAFASSYLLIVRMVSKGGIMRAVTRNVRYTKLSKYGVTYGTAFSRQLPDFRSVLRHRRELTLYQRLGRVARQDELGRAVERFPRDLYQGNRNYADGGENRRPLRAYVCSRHFSVFLFLLCRRFVTLLTNYAFGSVGVLSNEGFVRDRATIRTNRKNERRFRSARDGSHGHTFRIFVRIMGRNVSLCYRASFFSANELCDHRFEIINRRRDRTRLINLLAKRPDKGHNSD